jgi:subfamily B ATP-binding cassette protein MsbA
MAAAKKISRQDIEKLSMHEFIRIAQEPYRKLLAYLKPYRVRFALGLLFAALYGAANGLLIFSMKHVGSAVFPSDSPAGKSSHPSKAMEWVSQYIPMPDTNSAAGVLIVCMTVPMIMMFRGLFSYLNAYYMMWVSLKVLDDIRKKLFTRMMRQSLSYFNKAKSGELIQTVFNQTRVAQTALTTISSDVIKQPLSIISAVFALFVVDWRFTLIALVLFPVCMLPVVLVGKKIRKSGEKEEEEAGLIMVVMQEAFAGIRVVKTHAREDYECERFYAANEKMMRVILRWRKAMEMVGPMVETVSSFGIAAALIYAWYYQLGIGKFIALQGGLVLLYPPFKTLSRVHLMMQKCLAATSKVFALMELKPEIEDVPDAKKLVVRRGEIILENVTFGFRSDYAAVNDVSLIIPEGSTCALVGASGAGKSTLMALIQRLYDTTKGKILIDGQNIRDVTQSSLHRNIGTVSQDTFLFHDTIYKNILYGRLDATQDEVYAAARQAFAHDFILEQPSGYDSVVGDKGCLLSGGQQQRISIARALLKNAPILLLDEATSALDSEAEKQIQMALERLAKGRTVVAIAHRLSTILNSDQIVVMDQGSIVATGTHTELYEQSPHYRRLYDLQYHGHHDDDSEVDESRVVAQNPLI